MRPDDELTEQTIKGQVIVRERLGKVSHYCYYPREAPDLTLGSQDMICNIYMYNTTYITTTPNSKEDLTEVTASSKPMDKR